MNTFPLFKRDILLSVRPLYASKIIRGEKTVELRRRFPETVARGTKMVIYSSSPVRAIVGHTQIEDVLKLPPSRIWKDYGRASCVTKDAFDDYFWGVDYGFAILIGHAKALNNQIKADDLYDEFGFVPPQSFRYLNEGCNFLLSDERIQSSRRHARRHRA
jgi:predicted transcriptional regulator